MTYKTLYFRKEDRTKAGRYFIFDTEAEMLTDTLIRGDQAFCTDTASYWVAISSTEWVRLSSSGSQEAVIDGGAADQTYLPSMVIDCGFADSSSSSFQNINGGSA